VFVRLVLACLSPPSPTPPHAHTHPLHPGPVGVPSASSVSNCHPTVKRDGRPQALPSPLYVRGFRRTFESCHGGVPRSCLSAGRRTHTYTHNNASARTRPDQTRAGAEQDMDRIQERASARTDGSTLALSCALSCPVLPCPGSHPSPPLSSHLTSPNPQLHFNSIIFTSSPHQFVPPTLLLVCRTCK